MSRASLLERLLVCSAALAFFVALSASPANATLVVDLRFAPGQPGMTDAWHVPTPTASLTYNVQVWGKVTGTNGVGTDEGLLYVYGSVLSQQISGGSFTGNGVPTATTRWAGGVGFTGTGNQRGDALDLNLDGVRDLGDPSDPMKSIKPSTSAADQDSLPCPVFNPDYADPSGMYHPQSFTPTYNPITNGTEFLVGTVRIQASATFGPGETKFNWVLPGWPSNPGYHNSSPDNAWPAFGGAASDGSQATYSAGGTSVTFGQTVPEPAAIALLAGACLGLLLFWRRKRS